MSLETMLTNSFLRNWYFNYYELPLLAKLDLPKGKKVLEIGCGSGHTTKKINELLEPSLMVSVDVVGKCSVLADAQQLPFPDNSFDIVIELCCFHHVVNWRKALKEVDRVCSDVFVFEDFPKERLESWKYRWFDHPKKDRFTEKEFLTLSGGTIIDKMWWGDAFFGVCYERTS